MSKSQELTKGRARLRVSGDLTDHMAIPMEQPKSGRIVWGLMEIKELVSQWRELLHLPEGYEIIGVFFEVLYYQWMLIIESADIPLPEEGMMLPEMEVSYQRLESGVVQLTELKVLS